ncbi:MAG: transglycosylase SLT domain-containing protein [Burkholderiaceae bacterium]|nr:transglycosylase SLT domain-containing protein [Burkholderiaceae bacterium]
MPDLPSTRVARMERMYLSDPAALKRMFERADRYLFHIVEEVTRRGLPTELALLPFVESAMNPAAVSSAKAVGLWQFIPSTGRAFDLKQNWWVDHRRDVVRSTRAALDYLEKIHAMHGNDWFLALASYNWGEHAVSRAVRRNHARGRGTDYLSLPMPRETRNYVPKLIALKHLVERADELRLPLPPLRDEPYFTSLAIARPMDLSLAARFAGMDVDDFVALNPSHNRPVIASAGNTHLKLPTDRLDAFRLALHQHEAASKPLVTWHPYTLRSGDTMQRVASKAGISTLALMKANGLSPRRQILPGTRILAPLKGPETSTQIQGFVGPRVVEVVHRPKLYHRVRRTDTLARIARRYGTSTSAIAKMNGLRRGTIRPGMRLLVRQATSFRSVTDERGRRQLATLEKARKAPPKAAPVAKRPRKRAAAGGNARASGSVPAAATVLVGGRAKRIDSSAARKRRRM